MLKEEILNNIIVIILNKHTITSPKQLLYTDKIFLKWDLLLTEHLICTLPESLNKKSDIVCSLSILKQKLSEPFVYS